MAQRKLTDAAILQLIDHLKEGVAYYEICELFNISESTVAAYAAARFGRHLPEVVDYAKQRHLTTNRRNRRRGLDKDTVCGIIDRLIAGDKPAELSREYNVAYTTIWGIATGRVWNDLECVQQYVRDYGEAWRSKTYNKLPPEAVQAIRQQRKDGVDIKAIAAEFDVNKSMISRIVNGTRRQNG